MPWAPPHARYVLHAIALVIILVLAHMVLAAQCLGSGYGAGAAMHIPLLGIASVAWFFHGQRGRWIGPLATA